MAWREIVLTHEQFRMREDQRLQRLFEQVFEAAERPHDAALFGSAGRQTAGDTFYLSPRAVELFDFYLSEYVAKACQPPDQESVALLVGHPRAWGLLQRKARG